MSNYTKATNFAIKDGLPTGDASKRVRGTEIDDEFNSIATVITTKANSNNSALTGTPTAPTASAGTASTVIATTAFTSSAITTAIAAIPTPPDPTVAVENINLNGTLVEGKTIYIKNSVATGGNDGDIWFEY